MKELRRSNAVPEMDHTAWMRRVKAGQRFHFTVYSVCFWGVYVHWWGGRTLPCYEKKEVCSGHRLGAPSKWLGYLYVHNHDEHKDEFLELPNGAAKELEKMLGACEQLRGTRMRCTRGNGKGARIQIELLPRHEIVAPNTKLPASQDPEKLLRKMWGINESHLKLAGSDEVPEIRSA